MIQGQRCTQVGIAFPVSSSWSRELRNKNSALCVGQASLLKASQSVPKVLYHPAPLYQTECLPLSLSRCCQRCYMMMLRSREEYIYFLAFSPTTLSDKLCCPPSLRATLEVIFSHRSYQTSFSFSLLLCNQPFLQAVRRSCRQLSCSLLCKLPLSISNCVHKSYETVPHC